MSATTPSPKTKRAAIRELWRKVLAATREDTDRKALKELWDIAFKAEEELRADAKFQSESVPAAAPSGPDANANFKTVLGIA